mmetsp:Transcript_78410/g.197872  ORF Transcript_78410/g.197872 Transcript_78410/m.197872 type:complete len:206 (-) Transcript_78410:546-1163(-)
MRAHHTRDHGQRVELCVAHEADLAAVGPGVPPAAPSAPAAAGDRRDGTGGGGVTGAGAGTAGAAGAGAGVTRTPTAVHIPQPRPRHHLIHQVFWGRRGFLHVALLLHHRRPQGDRLARHQACLLLWVFFIPQLLLFLEGRRHRAFCTVLLVSGQRPRAILLDILHQDSPMGSHHRVYRLLLGHCQGHHPQVSLKVLQIQAVASQV